MAFNVQKRPPLGSYSPSPRKEDGDNSCESAHHSSNNVEETSAGSRENGLKFDGSSMRRYQTDIKVDPADTKKQILFILLIFVTAIGVLAFVYLKFPNMSLADKEKFKLPKNLDDAKDLGRVLSNYKDEFFLQVVLGFMATYIFLNAFAIPGSIFLSILSGFLFPLPLALFLVCLCTSAGSSLCYSLSSIVGKKLVQKYFPERIKEWKKHVDHHRQDLLHYIIFLRITPFLPNWFINITSPVLDVALWPFFLGTFIGVAPPSFGYISAGFELYELTTTGDALSFKSITLVVVAAVVSLLPVIFRKKMQEKLE
ncbi:transmembrane protein 41B-like [Rhopilema esculentum]|uniref:transmembrane protein 41B-like n=1 Tax=Rhopilema esculentum TaxID=499914 RepID=UPI0031D09294|eukprot:gene11374-21568_t